MDASSAFTTYDFVIFGVFLVFVVRGFLVGFLSQLCGFLGLYFGYFVASQYHTALFPFLEKISTNPKVVFLASYALCFLITFLVILLIGKALKTVVEVTIAGSFNRLLGGVVGAAESLIVITTMHLVLGALLAPENTTLRDCASCEVVGEMSEFARELIRDPEARQALLPKEPAISLEKVKDYLEPITPK